MADKHSKSGRKPRVTDEDLLNVFRATTDPVLSTAEVSEQVPIKRRGTLRRLRTLEDNAQLESKQIGGRNTVWWLPNVGATHTPTMDEGLPSTDEDVTRRTGERTDTKPPTEPDADEDGKVTLPSEIDDKILDAVKDTAEGWERDDRLETRKQAAAAILQYALDTGGAVGKSHAAIDAVREAFPVEGQNRETYWRKNLRDGILKRYGDYSKATHGYTITDLEGE